MSAYVIVQVDVKDPARYEAYKAMVPPSMEKYGGRLDDCTSEMKSEFGHRFVVQFGPPTGGQTRDVEPGSQRLAL